MNKIWFIADTHWNHNNIIELDNRPINYQEIIKDNWINLVHDSDTVIHLGDVIFSRQSELLQILHELPGTKILVKGNHDNESSQWYINKGFSLVVRKLEMSQKGKRFTCTHIPDKKIKDDEINIHGHLHMNNHRDEECEPYLTNRHILINFKDGFKPILLTDILNKSS